MKLHNDSIKRYVRISLVFIFIAVLAISFYGFYLSNLHFITQNGRVTESNPIISRSRRASRRDGAAVELDGSQSKFDFISESNYIPKIYVDKFQKFNGCAYLIAQFSILTITAMILFVINIRLWVVKSTQFKYKQVYLHYVHRKDGKKDAGLLNFAF